MTKQQADALKGLYDNAGMSQDVCIAAQGGADGTEYGVSRHCQTGAPCEWDYMAGVEAFCEAYKAMKFFGESLEGADRRRTGERMLANARTH